MGVMDKDDVFNGEFSPTEEKVENVTTAEIVENKPLSVEPVEQGNKDDIEIKPSFPSSDYDKKGNLKKVRFRMLKKLIKYEVKALISPLLIASAVLLAFTLFTCFFFNLENMYGEDIGWFVFGVLGIIFYMFAALGVIIVTFITSVVRYEKNFFKGQAYLTFSIPASAEEQVLAKHISALLMMLLATVIAVLSFLLVAICQQELFKEIFDQFLIEYPSMEMLPHDFMMDVEEILLSIVQSCVSFAVWGAIICYEKSFTKKSQLVVRAVILYVGFMVISSIVTHITIMDTFQLNAFFTSAAGIHLSNWLEILFTLGFGVFCFWYEVRTFTKKMNLK